MTNKAKNHQNDLCISDDIYSIIIDYSTKSIPTNEYFSNLGIDPNLLYNFIYAAYSFYKNLITKPDYVNYKNQIDLLKKDKIFGDEIQAHYDRKDSYIKKYRVTLPLIYDLNIEVYSYLSTFKDILFDENIDDAYFFSLLLKIQININKGLDNFDMLRYQINKNFDNDVEKFRDVIQRFIEDKKNSFIPPKNIIKALSDFFKKNKTKTLVMKKHESIIENAKPENQNSTDRKDYNSIYRAYAYYAYCFLKASGFDYYSSNDKAGAPNFYYGRKDLTKIVLKLINSTHYSYESCYNALKSFPFYEKVKSLNPQADIAFAVSLFDSRISDQFRKPLDEILSKLSQNKDKNKQS